MRNNTWDKRLLFLLGLMLMPATSLQAFCPVCVVAVGAGLELSHYFGIDDVVTGLWIGALLIAISAWTLEWLKKKNITFKGEKALVYFAYYALTIFPLFWYGFMGQDNHFFWGVDKLLLGIVLGSLFFLLGGMWHFWLKKKNDDKVYFPFQKVVIPVGLLLLLSFIFYFLTQ